MEKVEKSNTQHPKACLCFHLELHRASTNTISFALTLGDRSTEVLWTAPKTSVSQQPNGHSKPTTLKSQFC